MEVASENFESLSYRELQALAKARSVKANGKKEQLIRRLTEVHHIQQQEYSGSGTAVRRQQQQQHCNSTNYQWSSIVLRSDAASTIVYCCWL